jgi:hypothetical protein
LESLPTGNWVAAGKGDGPRCELVGGDVMRRGLSDLEKSLYRWGVGSGDSGIGSRRRGRGRRG